MAIWCAASEARPKVPIASAAPLNSATSNTMVMPMGRPRRNSSAKRCPVRPPPAVQDAVALQRRHRQADRQHGDEAEDVGAGAGDARAVKAQAREAEMAEDQRIVEAGIPQHGHAHHHQRRHGARQGGGEAAQHLEAHGEGQAPGQAGHEDGGVGGQHAAPGRKQQQDGAGEDQRRQQRQRDQRHRPQAHAHRDAHFALVARLGCAAHARPGHGRSPATPPWAGRCPAARPGNRRCCPARRPPAPPC